MYIYSALHNVLRDYKNLLLENRRTRIYKTCTDRRKNSIFPPSKLFFIVVHTSAARRCEFIYIDKMAAAVEKSFCMLEYHTSMSVVTVQRAFRAKYAK